MDTTVRCLEYLAELIRDNWQMLSCQPRHIVTALNQDLVMHVTSYSSATNAIPYRLHSTAMFLILQVALHIQYDMRQFSNL